MTFLRSLLAFACTSALLSGCYSDMSVMRDDAAKRTAAPVFMIPRDIPSEKFIIQAYERVYKKGNPATVYIEGDGTHTIAIKAFSRTNPTPTDPVGLRLAAQDGGENVIWVARPCQYNKGWKDGKTCPSEYSTSKRFSPEVIETYHQVLDNLKSYYNIPSFDLVGYDGGAAIAVILGSQRADILSIRTVAGNLDSRTLSYLTKEPYSPESLNPADFAAGIANIPQRHFIGKMDSDTPPAIYSSFLQTSENRGCMNVTLVDQADHQSGWAEQWKVLKSIPVDCAANAEAAPVRFDPTPLDGDKTHLKRRL